MNYQRLKRYLEETGTPAYKVEDAAGLGRCTIYRWNPENGNPGDANLSSLKKVAEATGIPIEELL